MSSLDGIAVPPVPEKRAWWRRARLGVGLRQLALVAAAILALYPVWFMLSTAFKGQDQYLNDLYGFPWPLEGGNFSEAVRGGAFFTWMKNSAILTAGSAALATIVRRPGRVRGGADALARAGRVPVDQRRAPDRPAGRDADPALHAVHPVLARLDVLGRGHPLRGPDPSVLRLPALELLQDRCRESSSSRP